MHICTNPVYTCIVRLMSLCVRPKHIIECARMHETEACMHEPYAYMLETYAYVQKSCTILQRTFAYTLDN